MSSLDWLVITLYLLAMLALAWFLGRSQGSRKDYYLAAEKLPPWALSTSIIATQCSTNSLLGAPAFVGFVLGGGMLWLQYELAVPLAMLVLCFAFIPIRRSGVISIYAFLEERLGRGTRLLASACFLFFRGVATGVTVYGVASVIELITGVEYWQAALMLMGVTIVYDLMGGMRAVVISDVIQMVLLIGAMFVALFWLIGPLTVHWADLSDRSVALANDWGITTGNNYGFWPMFIGGLFLYAAYYGCDQSQAQRLLSAADERATETVLKQNGLWRFPLVLAYCLLGLGLAAYAMEHSGFIDSLPKTEAGLPNLNLVFPAFVQQEFAPGLVGLTIVGLFAAAMSSIDSALNSLSASTVEDFWLRHSKQQPSEKSLFLASKVSTGLWGVFILAFSFEVEAIAPTVLEAINKVSSMVNGPLLALFAMALLMPRIGQKPTIVGFLIGLAANALVAIYAPTVSWLWWNPLGCIVAILGSLMAGYVVHSLPKDGQGLGSRFSAEHVTLSSVPKPIVIQLLAMTALIMVVCLLLTFSA